MSKTESYKPENTNKYNPNNREFIGYKSELLENQSKGRESNNSRDKDYKQSNRDNNRDFRPRGND